MSKRFSFSKSSCDDVIDIIKQHSLSLSSPWDAFLENQIFEIQIYSIQHEDFLIGYAGIRNETLVYFYVNKSFYRYAPNIFENFVNTHDIKEVEFLTNDPLLASLIAEWEYKIRDRGGCFFTDAGRIEKPMNKLINPIFRQATQNDIGTIIKHTGDFFENIEIAVEKDKLFLLEENGQLLGCGIVEKGLIHIDCCTIGMITCKEHRQKGVAQMILWNLKEWAYKNNFKPVSGCWYYNVLSRKSLEDAGMVATGKSYIITLHSKKMLPLRTGNPPGEDV